MGEALAVDCSFGSSGGRPVPSTQAAGTRHRHPWLFQIVSGEAGQVKAGSPGRDCLKTFEVQLVSAVTGRCERSRRANFTQRCSGRERANTGAAEGVREKPAGGTNTETSDASEGGTDELDRLEQGIARLHHSVFWEEVFDSIKVESLVDGRNGWLAHHKERSDSGSAATQSASKLDGANTGTGAGTKRRLMSSGAKGMLTGEHDSGVPVVHVMDDEVMVRMDSQHLLGYKLVPDGAGPDLMSKSKNVKSSCAPDRLDAEEQRLQELGDQRFTSLCRLALLYGGSLLRQHQQINAQASKAAESTSDRGGVGRMRVATGSSAGSGSGAVLSGRPSTKAGLWGSVGGVLRHQLFCKEVRWLKASNYFHVDGSKQPS